MKVKGWKQRGKTGNESLLYADSMLSMPHVHFVGT